MLAAVRARQAGLVEAQLSKLILTRALATDNVWDKACKVCRHGANICSMHASACWRAGVGAVTCC
jgi:hypothetical protein